MFRDRGLARGPAQRGRGSQFRGAGGVGPWPAKGRQFNTPYSNNRNKPKQQQKQPPKAANSTAVGEDPSLNKWKIMILPDPERKYVEDEIEKIKEAILEALEPLEDGYFPQFFGVSFSKGTLMLRCANEQSKQWLEKIVPQLKPWEGAKLKTKPKGEAGEGSKVQLKTPKLFAKTDPKKILEMLSAQNKTIDTSSWKTVSVTTEESGRTLVYTVDSQALEAIRALNGKVYLGLGNAELVVLNDEDEKQTSADTETKKAEDDKQTSVDTDMKSAEDSDKQGSVEIKKEKEADKPTS